MQRPVLQHAARPRYPAEVSPPVAADVEVLAVIDEDGDVAARVLYAPEPRAPFEREALAAVGRYAFEPGAIDGKPVPVVVTLMVPFRTPLAGRSPARIVGGTADPPPGAASRLVGMADAPGDDIVRPLPLAKVYPGIPGPGAALAGRVEMLIIVNAQGQVAEVDVTRSLAPDFDHAAVAAVRQWVFEPAIRKGGAVPVLLQVFLTIDDEG